MKEFGYVSATMTVEYHAGLDESNEPILKSTTFRNIAENVTAAQLHTVAQVLFSLSEHDYVQAYKTQKDLIV